jgi:hypothetical protein
MQLAKKAPATFCSPVRLRQPAFVPRTSTTRPDILSIFERTLTTARMASSLLMSTKLLRVIANSSSTEVSLGKGILIRKREDLRAYEVFRTPDDISNHERGRLGRKKDAGWKLIVDFSCAGRLISTIQTRLSQIKIIICHPNCFTLKS